MREFFSTIYAYIYCITNRQTDITVLSGCETVERAEVNVNRSFFVLATGIFFPRDQFAKSQNHINVHFI